MEELTAAKRISGTWGGRRRGKDRQQPSRQFEKKPAAGAPGAEVASAARAMGTGIFLPLTFFWPDQGAARTGVILVGP